MSTTRHDQLGYQDLHHSVSLIACEASYRGNSTIQPGPRGFPGRVHRFPPLMLKKDNVPILKPRRRMCRPT